MPPVATPLAEKLQKAERGELTLEEMKDLIAIIKANQEIEHIHDVRDTSRRSSCSIAGLDRRAETEQAARRIAVEAHAEPA